ncbi:unnamed protein product [Plutella xylostella]|uniref:(diamondback moth) hypothetical protein n=1 Tax=Plutella xylostella TaxID=51655 RepID=A0A8S4GBF5_PLUXY|nr:unnamed protein product [Plutella xylostella]
MLSVYYQNVRGLRTKTNQFYRNICLHSFDLIAVTESWLNDSIYDSELFDGRYCVWRRDRDYKLTNQELGGGVLLATRKHLSVTPRPNWNSSAEDLWISINLSRKSVLHIGIIYLCKQNQGYTKSQQLSNFLLKLNDIILSHPSDKFLVLGDFNLGNINWTKHIKLSHYLPSNYDELNFVDHLDTFGFSQYNGISNQYSRFLDLVVSNSDVSVEECQSPLVPLDPHHKALCITYKCSDFNPLKLPPRTVHLYSKSDWDSINTGIQNFDWNKAFHDKLLHECVEIFYDKLYSLRDQFVPSKVLKSTSHPPWYSPALIKILKEKNKYFLKFKNYGNKSDFNSYCILRSRAKMLETECYDAYITRVEESIKLNPKTFWSFAKSKAKTNSLPSCMTFEGNITSSGDEICKLFSDYFYSTFLEPDKLNPSDSPGEVENLYHDCHISSIQLDRSIIHNHLKRLDTCKSAGPDKIPPIYLVKCAEQLSFPIYLLFEKSLKEGKVPDIWKAAFVSPIHKKGPKNDVKNYRPISKLCIIAKVFEKIVQRDLNVALKTVFKSTQHGFLRGRSTVTNLLLYNELLTETMDQGYQADVVYTDYSKAFDRIDHSLLLIKLFKAGIRGNLFRWFSSYVSNRTQAVVASNFQSDWVNIPSGVPQGSILGPLLFLLLISDIDSCFSNSSIYIFADDMKIVKPIINENDIILLQNDLNNLDKYCNDNKLDLNPSKCSTITFTRKRQPTLTTYFLKGHAIGRDSKIKDLGVIHDSKLLFDAHIDAITAKTSKALGFIMRLSTNFKQAKTFKILYCTYVRSNLEYASQVWNPRYTVYIDRIERIQKRFMRYLSYRVRYPLQNYKEGCRQFHILPLINRREICDLLFLLKIATSQIDCPQLLEKLKFYVPNRSRRFNPTFSNTTVSTNYRQNSYLWRACNNFNHVSNNLDIDIFNTSINKARNILSCTFFDV